MEEDNKATKEDLETLDGALERAEGYLSAVPFAAINVQDAICLRLLSSQKLSDFLQLIRKVRKAAAIELTDWDKMQTMTDAEKVQHVIKQLK